MQEPTYRPQKSLPSRSRTLAHRQFLPQPGIPASPAASLVVQTTQSLSTWSCSPLEPFEERGLPKNGRGDPCREETGFRTRHSLRVACHAEMFRLPRTDETRPHPACPGPKNSLMKRRASVHGWGEVGVGTGLSHEPHEEKG